MAFYGHPPQFQLYAYAPMPIPNHEFYAVYPTGSHPGVGSPLDASQFYYEPSPKSSYAGQLLEFFTYFLLYFFHPVTSFLKGQCHEMDIF